MTSRRRPLHLRPLLAAGACALVVGGATSTPAAAITRSPGASSSGSAAASSNPAGELAVQSPSASPSTVKGPTSPTVDEPGDNQPALVLGGLGVTSVALAGAFVVARRRITDDPR